MTDAFIGIDLAIAKKKRLPISICTWRDGRLIPEALRKLSIEPPKGHGNAAVLDEAQVTDFIKSAAKYINDACELLSLVPRRIAIDAPSGPREEGTRRRAAESAMDKAGISCFTTPTADEFEIIFEKVRRHLKQGGAQASIPHANQLWMSVGFQLFDELNQLAPCIEVFPQATARVVGSGQVHKSKSGAADAQLAVVAEHTGWPNEIEAGPDFFDIAFAPAHDRLDAYLSAWVAALEEPDRIAFGTPPDDVIWTPRIGDTKYQEFVPAKNQASKNSQKPQPRSTPAKIAKDCPACGQTFKRWPFGWDSHAAHRCTGLNSKGTAARKAEFKQRFGRLFHQPKT
jgi:hypothetical protein